MTTLVHAIEQRLAARSANAAECVQSPARPRTRRLPLVVLGDVAAVTAALLVTSAPPWAFVFVPMALFVLALRHQYRTPPGRAVDVLLGVLGGVTLAAGALLLTAATVAPAALPAETLSHAWLLSCALVTAHRLAGQAGRMSEPGTPTVVLGPGAAEVARLLAMEPAAGVRPIASLELELSAHGRDADLPGLARLARETGAADVVIVPGAAGDETVAALTRACAAEQLGVAVRSALSDTGAALAVQHAGPVSLVRLRPAVQASPALAAKHALDRAVAAFMLLAVAPIFAALALAVRLSSPGPVFYRQRRVGRDGREFDMLKFRSMRPADGPAEQPVAALRAGAAPGGVEGADRRTPIGTLLRRTSLDELPQLVNVLRGDMSLVGPRPERPEYVDRFSRDIERYADRHRLKSGMTGLAQVNGLRGKTSIRDRVAYDNHYVEHWSLALDVKILLQTIRAVFDPAE